MYCLWNSVLQPAGSERQIEELLRWNKANKPPMSIVKSQFEDFLITRNSLLGESLKMADGVLGSLLRGKANISILRAYLNLVREHWHGEVDALRMKELWKQLPLECLELFLETFKLGGCVAPEE